MLEIKKKLALACRVLYMEGLGDLNLGHVSGRVPNQDNFYMKPRGLGLEEIRAEDLILMDTEGNKLDGKYPPHGETPIHTEIYRIRNDVQSIVHVHPIISTAFSCVRIKMKPINQDGVLFPRGIPTIQNPELVVTKKQGEVLAEKLGESKAILLQNHGIVTVGGSIEEACLNALFLERALKVQLTASLLGKVVPISEKIVLNMFTMFNQNPKRSEEIWDYLVRKLKREGPAFDQS